MKFFRAYSGKANQKIRKGLKFRIVLSTPKFALLFSTFELNEEFPPFQKLQIPMEDQKTIRNAKHPLISKLESYINANLNNEQFGVEQLAEMMGMSRSHLHRKLHKLKGKSISRFIREYRLEAARKMLIEKEMTAAEVSHAVGFGSPSYFNKCFTEYFGYSPGKARLKVGQEIARKTESQFSKNKKLLWLGGLAAAVLIGFLIFSQNKKDEVIAETPPKEKSIIVLPFKNLSSDEENQYLADGMVDAISRHLSGIGELKVFAPSAGGNLNSMTEIGNKLNVSNVLNGSIQTHDSVLRVEIKLIATEDEKQLWAESYDRKFSELLEIQNDISKKVVEALKIELSHDENSRINRQTSYDSEAYNYYIKGLYYLNLFNVNNQHLAEEYFEKALALDSTMPQVYSGLAAYNISKASVAVAKIDGTLAFKLAEPYLDKALELDPDHQYAHIMKAFISTYNHWDFDLAEKYHLKGVSSFDPMGHHTYRDFLHHENRHQEAMEIAMDLRNNNPFQPGAIMILPYFYNNEIAKGKKYIEEQLEVNPNNFFTWDNAGFFYLNIGEPEKAIEFFENLLSVFEKRFPRTLGLLGAAYAKKGDSEMANEILNELKEAKSKSDAGAPAFFIAIVHSALDEKQEALKWLKIAIDDHEQEVPWLVSEPQLYPLHGMPEFDALVKRVGFREHAYPVELPKSPPSSEASGLPTSTSLSTGKEGR